MTYSTEEEAIILTHELLHVIARLDLASRQTLDELDKRLSSAGMSHTLTHMVRDMIAEIELNGIDP